VNVWEGVVPRGYGVFLNELVKNGGRNTFEGGGWEITRGFVTRSDTVYMGVNGMHSHVKICLSPQ
jgi:hypothetical protein